MKSAIILVLLGMLLATAYFTRPSPADFKRYIGARDSQSASVTTADLKEHAATMPPDCTFVDHLLWVNVKSGDRTIYTGAFAHWFSRAQIADSVKAVKQDVKAVKDGRPE